MPLKVISNYHDFATVEAREFTQEVMDHPSLDQHCANKEIRHCSADHINLH